MTESFHPARKPIPDEKIWRAVLSSFDTTPSTRQLSEKFDVSPTVVYRWRKETPDFNEACEMVLKKPIRPPPEKFRIVSHLTPDDIDELLYVLLCDTPSASTLKRARFAIRQLRKELRHERSTVNALRVAEHIRRTSRGLSVHANGGGPHERV